MKEKAECLRKGTRTWKEKSFWNRKITTVMVGEIGRVSVKDFFTLSFIEAQLIYNVVFLLCSKVN